MNKRSKNGMFKALIIINQISKTYVKAITRSA